MKQRRALKPKNIQKLELLQSKHPGDLTEQEKAEMAKLQHLRATYGQV